MPTFKSIAEARRVAGERRKQLEALRESVLHEAKVKKARADMELAAKVYEAMLREARQRIQPDVDRLAADVRAAEQVIFQMQRAEREAVPARVRDWLQAIRNGTDYGPVEFKVRWVSKDERFAIVTWPGHNFWSSRTDPNAYAATTHWLVDLDKWNPKVKENGSRIRSDCTVAEYEGRLTKNILEDWQKNVDLVYRK